MDWSPDLSREQEGATDPNRRGFLRQVAMGASAGAVLGSSAHAASGQEAARPANPQQGDKPVAEDRFQAEVDARMNLVLARYGEHLDEQAREEVRRQVEGVVRQGQALRALPLENSDEPFPVFRPYRASND